MAPTKIEARILIEDGLFDLGRLNVVVVVILVKSDLGWSREWTSGVVDCVRAVAG